MTPTSTRLFVALALAATAASAPAIGQTPAEPYKLGMFRQDARAFVGLVLGDSTVVDLSQADVQAPATLHELVSRWNDAMAERLGALAAEARRQRPAYAYDLSALTVLPPITYPSAILMAARNYEEHATEMAQAGRTAGTTTTVDENVRRGLPGLWTRPAGDTRGNPYLFPKLRSSIIADGEPIVLPDGRGSIDFECELVAVIGRTARDVSVDEAANYIFGYTMMTDVSDREDRADGRYGSDWLIGKSHDTFGPLGPFVVPSAFVGDPHQLAVKYTLNGEAMQDATTALMTHNTYELLAFASSIATLQPGDLLGTGTPGGVGTARVPPVYLKSGDRGACSIEKIGTLANPVK